MNRTRRLALALALIGAGLQSPPAASAAEPRTLVVGRPDPRLPPLRAALPARRQARAARAGVPRRPRRGRGRPEADWSSTRCGPRGLPRGVSGRRRPAMERRARGRRLRDRSGTRVDDVAFVSRSDRRDREGARVDPGARLRDGDLERRDLQPLPRRPPLGPHRRDRAGRRRDRRAVSQELPAGPARLRPDPERHGGSAGALRRGESRRQPRPDHRHRRGRSPLGRRGRMREGPAWSRSCRTPTRSDACRVERSRWSGGRDGTEVVLYALRGRRPHLAGRPAVRPESSSSAASAATSTRRA